MSSVGLACKVEITYTILKLHVAVRLFGRSEPQFLARGRFRSLFYHSAPSDVHFLSDHNVLLKDLFSWSPKIRHVVVLLLLLDLRMHIACKCWHSVDIRWLLKLIPPECRRLGYCSYSAAVWCTLNSRRWEVQHNWIHHFGLLTESVGTFRIWVVSVCNTLLQNWKKRFFI